MRTFEMNIGLENTNEFNAAHIERILQAFITESTIQTRLHVGEWDGEPELTLVIRFESSAKRITILQMVKYLCTLLTQEAIPVKDSEGGILIYNDNFTGEKMVFDPQYFINY